MRSLADWRRRRLLRRHALADPDWRDAVAACPIATRLDPEARDRLRELTTLFLATKRFHGAAGLEIAPRMALSIAVQAAVPILGLGFDWYRGWTSVIVYPGAFVVRREEADETGVVHRTRRDLLGEAWDRGPLILSWEDARPDAQTSTPGTNVVIHECAHKLDLLDGSANGHPPLHPEMDPDAWSAVLAQGYATLRTQIRTPTAPALDPYAGTSPAEFFAVASEVFFGDPQRLAAFHPGVYAQLRAFYRQDPLPRLEEA